MTIQFESSPSPRRRYTTGVSLHSHTDHSKESLSFIYRYAAEVPVLKAAVKRGERQYQERHNGASLDFSRAWWTPPLSPHDAWLLEKNHIEQRDMKALVSISDHDDIEAGMSLNTLSECRDVPVSVEWTVPHGQTFFHIGVHNLPPSSARALMARFAEITARPLEGAIREILDYVASLPATLIVFNHPCWDESQIGAAAHRAAMLDFINRYRPWLHAVEINGLRPWTENRAVLDLAQAEGLPAVSGGDRHALEANTVLNLTNARSFAAFAAEVRERQSHLLITSQYEQPFKLRVLRSISDILDERWMERVYYICEDGVTRNLKELFHDHTPAAVRVFCAGVNLLHRGIARQPARLAFWQKWIGSHSG